jgi:RHH-type proline utilization regulon transcriptional repressor/proline dehydrogenase/delta 1-pyrroline-5-carboxylate dehydrogenase
MDDGAWEIPTFSAPYAQDDETIAAELLGAEMLSCPDDGKIANTARCLIERIRAKARGRFGGIDELLREYSISTKEGLALMVLAEALLRAPDQNTADRLIEDKLEPAFFTDRETTTRAPLITASAWVLGIAARIVEPTETPESVIHQMAKGIGVPAVRMAIRQGMRILANHFVLGETIDQALAHSKTRSGKNYRYSFDMLGEGARTRDDANRYFRSYSDAIAAIGSAASQASLPDRPGISIKLSALHPRYEATNRQGVLDELIPDVVALAQQAKFYNLNFTVDAEEADRLELSLDVIARVFADPSLADWDGFGLAIQAYQKRAIAAVDYISALATAHDRRMMVRLVKGAYWDTEIKRAQERGLPDYPVFTRKAMTDLNYLACAKKLLSLRPGVYPQFATHNALTIASIVAAADGGDGYEFQRLQGMGEALYAALFEIAPDAQCRIYAPVGNHNDLLPYLVRRLLENGANTSFTSAAANPDIPIEGLLRQPPAIIGTPAQARHPMIPVPPDLYGTRRNSQGVELGHSDSLQQLLAEVHEGFAALASAAPIIDGATVAGTSHKSVSPINGASCGQVILATAADVDRAVHSARTGFAAWRRIPVEGRAEILERAACMIESRRGRFIQLLAVEGGKTIDDALSEVREAVDFCRYYATEARRLFGAGMEMPGPTGETNVLKLRPRGVFVAISPWNFPLAIFLGQIVAALASGNTVIAKPAEQTPLIAAEAVKILHECGVPRSALHLLPGNGEIGALAVGHALIDGVVFTGSTDVACSINRVLAAKDGAIVPLIAETGGINAMIVDGTALPEQVTDDVIASAFRSAGQRCSALRLLCVEDSVATRMIKMIVGAAREMKIGDPREPSTQIGPVIDRDAKDRLDKYIARMKTTARTHFAGTAPNEGTFVAPHIFELDDPGSLRKEIFGPILHIVQYPARRFEQILRAISNSGYGLTLGIESRLNDKAARIVEDLAVGNIYINRNMIGAVVGVQPFGGCARSGTGPKAGGPYYLHRFATEQTVTINTAAAGGNAALISLDA